MSDVHLLVYVWVSDVPLACVCVVTEPVARIEARELQGETGDADLEQNTDTPHTLP